jgi:hypothetical protein
MDKYHVVVTRLHVASWEWEIYRNSEPLPVRMRDGPYKSVRTAESVGSVALREFLQALNREKSLAVNPRPLLGRPPRRPPPWAAPVNGLSWLPLPSKSYRQAA